MDGFIRQVSTLPPGLRLSGISMRVHLAIREASLIGGGTGGRVDSDVALGDADGGPAEVGASRFRRGPELSRINRS